MGYNISTLPDFATQGKGFVIDSILQAQTIKLLTAASAFNPSAKGMSTVQLLNRDLIIQNGTSCGFTPTGGVDLTQATLFVHPLKINETFCDNDLERIWAVGELPAGREYDTMLFQADIAALTVAKAQAELEAMIWLGDTALTGATTSRQLNLKQLDGFVKQIKAGSYIPLVLSGATTIAKLQAAFSEMPIQVTDSEDFRILIGKDTFNKMKAELATANLFQAAVDGELWGTSAKYEIVSGLNSTGTVIATRLQNLQSGGEMTDVSYDSWYSRDQQELRAVAKFSLGVVPIYVQSIGYGQIV